MKNKRLIVIVVAVLVVAAGAYKFVLAAPAETHGKVDGTVFVLPKEFLVNLDDGRYAKVNVALVLGKDPLAKAGHGTPPDGYGGMEEEAVVRDVVVDALGDQSAETLSSTAGRERVKRVLRRELNKATDIDVRDVLFPDVTVQ
ncbi:MAG: flagellar basal body-associated FliL family protein [Solirubrobacteraceae bacterium]|nr:flagellar basal body-associated FliL family protein [Solirubrobacteraceae bacterium]